MKENVRAEYWLKCWIQVANSETCRTTSVATDWADRMLSEFDRRFPEFKPETPKEKE